MEPTSQISSLVLVVDDDQDTREMYELFLEISGYRVRSASDVGTALDMALADVPDVVVTDYMLKGALTGADLCRSLKADTRTAHVPSLLVTGSTRRADAEAALGAGCSDIRVKPYPLEALLQDLQSLLGPPSGGVSVERAAS